MKLDPIKISENGRFLSTYQPFFWLADTAWELFHRLDLAETEFYLETRRRQGFNVIQAVILAELDGLHTPTAQGHVPLLGDDPARPNEYYFRHVDQVIDLAREKGLYMGLLPTWGDKVHSGLWGIGPAVFDEQNARTFGEFLGQRYQHENHIVWILGGDRPAEGYEPLWSAMAEGLTTGSGYLPLMTYHPQGGNSSSTWLHEAEWLALNVFQSGHGLVDAPTWEMVTADYGRHPIKPVLDGEPNYEDHPIDPFSRSWQPAFGRFTDYDVRKQAYRAVFAGACGHTYGNHAVWQFWHRHREPVNFPLTTWDEALLSPGAEQLIHLKNLMLSRPYFSRIPDQMMLPDLLVAPSPVQREHENSLRAAHPRATRCAEGTYAMVYFPLAHQTLTVDLTPLAGKVKAWWFDPRNGKSYPAGEFQPETMSFTSPISGPDWVLVLDAILSDFSQPGLPL
ncbi:MAG: glycoside hydrolase family 140 protein [Ardenticatenaceae bacterium]|nr:glycoside hydrolase family 140 protein [Ardenticatenaceae bacterium]